MERSWVATCPKSIPPLLLRELVDLGAQSVKELPAGVEFRGTRALMYRVCLWSRLANKVLAPVGSGAAENADALYATVEGLAWHELLLETKTIAVEFHGTNADIRNTRFGAQRTKDAIVDAFRRAGKTPPAVDLDNPDMKIVVRLHRDRLEIALDMVGESLHRRGYRRAAGDAPIKENLAAALLLRAGWSELLKRDAALIDPMCGSATLLLEGALMAADIAPALERDTLGFHSWIEHDQAQWQAIRSEARGRAERGLAKGLPEIRGYDADPRVIRRAQENIAAAGLEKYVRVSVKALGEVLKPSHRPMPEGLVITNPPYGERIGNKEVLPQLYRRLGELLHDQFAGWQAAILVGDRELGHSLGLRSHKQYAFFNGRLPVSLLLIDLQGNRLTDVSKPASPWSESSAPRRPEVKSADALDDGEMMFLNRVRKNQKRLDRWLRRSGYSCYRLYDADMPEYAVAIDRYEDWLHVAEYKAPAQVSPESAARRLTQIRNALPAATGVDPQKIVFKQRERQRGSAQYERQAQAGDLLPVCEGDARLLVNLNDYLDTGLFLDHRPLRLRLGQECRGKRFLNLFCYTGSATVHAALGGARSTTSVDLSNTYLRWLSKNLAHNGLAETHNHVVRADVSSWLSEGSELYDIIFLDPPSFSNSSRVEGSFDVQRDQQPLIDLCMSRLDPAGQLYFSTNLRKFRLDPDLSERYICKDITAATLDPDFSRQARPHQCWQLAHPEVAGV